jgi:hypothetical protein
MQGGVRAGVRGEARDAGDSSLSSTWYVVCGMLWFQSFCCIYFYFVFFCVVEKKKIQKPAHPRHSVIARRSATSPIIILGEEEEA